MQVCVVKGYPKWFWIITFNSATIYAIAKKIKIAIYINSTTLKLGKKIEKHIRFFLVYIEHDKFQEASFKNNWDLKRWNKKFWINTFTSLSKWWNKKFWINTDLHLTQYTMKQKVLDQYLYLTQYTVKQKVLDQHLHLTH